MRFPIAFNGMSRGFLSALGLGPGRAYVDVGDIEVHVRMGYAFRGTVLRSSIRDVSPVDRVPWNWGIGVHGGRGLWVVNGTLRNLIRLDIEPHGRGRVLGVPVKLKKLFVSVEDPKAVAAALGH